MRSALVSSIPLALALALSGVPAAAQPADQNRSNEQIYSDLEALTNELGETSAGLGHFEHEGLEHGARIARPRPPVVPGNALDCTLGVVAHSTREAGAAAAPEALPLNCALGRLAAPHEMRGPDQSGH
jgi:hypothetical protein